MCGRYTLAAPDPGAVRARFGLAETVAIVPRYNVAPTDEVLAVSTDRAGTPRGERLRWGLVPRWAQSPAHGARMINARVETVAEKPAFRTALRHYRCLVCADGFYEWHRRDAAPGPRRACRITRSDGALFAFAGLWSIWHGPDETTVRSCTIITRPANDAVARLHDRMPVMLDPDREADWLDSATPVAALDEILAGLPAEALTVTEVGPAVNDARHDAPDCLDPPAGDAPQTALF